VPVKGKAKLIQHPNIKVCYGRILDKESLEQGMRGCEFVLHLAGYARVWSKDPDTFVKINVEGTFNVLETAKVSSVKKVVITSTAGVFGPSVDGEAVVEDSLRSVGFFNDYEKTKSMADDKALEYISDRLEVVIVHPTRVFGPGLLSDSNAVTTMISKYIEGKWHLLPGNGKSIGNYVYVDDVVNGHIFAMQKGRNGEKYILGGDNVSYNQFFDIVKEVSGKRFRLYKFPYFLMLFLSRMMLFLANFGIQPLITPGFVRRYHYHWINSSEKAEKELGYQITPLPEAIEKTIEWIKTR